MPALPTVTVTELAVERPLSARVTTSWPVGAPTGTSPVITSFDQARFSNGMPPMVTRPGVPPNPKSRAIVTPRFPSVLIALGSGTWTVPNEVIVSWRLPPSAMKGPPPTPLPAALTENIFGVLSAQSQSVWTLPFPTKAAICTMGVSA